MNATRLPLTNALHIYYAISMEETTTEAVRRALADGLQTILSIPAEPRDIRLPSRIAAAATPLAIAHGADAAAWAVLLNAERSRFPALYGAPLVSHSTAENGWLLFTLTSDFYSAVVMHTRSALPFPSRTDTYALHRMRMLSRRPTDDCPDVPEVQRALLLAFTAAELRTPAALANAERALLSMAYALPPADRQPLLDRCGGVADCACRLLSHVSG